LVRGLREKVADADTQAGMLTGFDDANPARPHVERASRLLGEAHAEISTATRLLEGQHSEQESRVVAVRRDLRDQGQQLGRYRPERATLRAS
jgi:hypothetical protein